MSEEIINKIENLNKELTETEREYYLEKIDTEYAEAETYLDVCNSIGEDGKKIYTNEQQRQAVVSMRMKDRKYRLVELKTRIQELQRELEVLKMKFNLFMVVIENDS